MPSQIKLTCVPTGIKGRVVSVDILVSPQLATQPDVDNMKNWHDWVHTNQNSLSVQVTAGSSFSIPLRLDITKLVNGAWEELFANATVGTAYQNGAQSSQLAISNAAVSMRSSHATVHSFFAEVMLRRQPNRRRLGPDHDFLHTLHDEAASRHGLHGTSASNSTVSILGLPPGSNGKDNMELVAGRLGISLVPDDTGIPVANAVRIEPANVAGSGLPDRAQAGIASLLDRMSSTPAVPVELELQTAPPVTYNSGSYALSFAILNGTGPLKWSILYLPNGLSYDANSGAISGSPVGPGAYHAAITVSDSSNPPRISIFRLQISVLPARLPDGFANKPYTAQMHAPAGPFTWSLMPGSSLPAGISLDASTGKLSGIPTATTVSPLTIDFKGVNGARTVHRKLSLAIASFGSVSLPNGLVGAPYSVATLPTQGKSPNRWNIVSGRLPEGLTLNSDTGAISGIPKQVGTGNFRVQMKDASPNPRVWELDYTMSVTRRHSVFAESVPPGLVGLSYTAILVKTTQSAFQYQVIDGTLPAGLDFDPHSGILSGIPTAPTLSVGGAVAAQNLTIAAFDGMGNTVERATLPLEILPNSASAAIPFNIFSPANLPMWPLGYAYAYQLTANSSNASWSLVQGSKLPDGLHLDTKSGLISGVARDAGVSQFTAQAQDASSNAIVTKAFSLRIEQHLLEHVNRISSNPRKKSSGRIVPDIVKQRSVQSGLDFDQCITLLLNMPVLMKAVGLALQGTFTIPDSVPFPLPDKLTIGLDLTNASKFQPNPVPLQTICTKDFLPSSTTGMLADSGWFHPTDAYTVGCLELDAEVKKQVQFGTRAGQRATGHAKSTSFQTADPAKVIVFDEDVVHPVLPPTQRTGGLQVWQHNRQDTASSSVTKAQTDAGSATPPPRTAEDLISGVAVDILHGDTWYHLTQRDEAYSFPSAHISISESGVVQGVRMAATRRTDQDSDQFDIDETVFNWRLGSLVAPPVFDYQAVGSRTRTLSTQVVPWSDKLKKFTKTISAPDIPSPLFGETYQVAMRPVYVTGGSVFFDDKQDQQARQAMLPPFTFQRYELIQGPEVIPAYISGKLVQDEAKTLMMVGSRLDEKLKASSYVDKSYRVIVPSRVTAEIARRHGKNQSAIDNGAKQIPLTDGALPNAISNSMHWSGKKEPYLPDPLCIGVIATITDLNGNLLVNSNGDFLQGTAPVDLDYLDQDIKWPDYIVHFIELQRADVGAQWATLLSPPPDADYAQANFPFPLKKSKKIVCKIPAGQTVLLYLHPKLSNDVLTQHALSTKTWQQGRATAQDISMSDICRPTVVRLSHAVDRPSGRPTVVSSDLIAVQGSKPLVYNFTRTPSNTMNLTVMAEPLSTNKVEVTAVWSDYVDDLTQAKPTWRPSHAQLAEFHIEKRTQSSPAVQPVHLPFSDTRYRRLSMDAKAYSRFATCFKGDKQHLATNSEQSVLVDVLATAPPAAPNIEMIRPALHWETNETKDLLTRTRTMGLTLVINRGTTSGNFEKLAVITSLDSSRNPIVKTADTSGDPTVDDSKVSAWGFMPDFELPGIVYFTQPPNGSVKRNCGPVPKQAADAAITLVLDDEQPDPNDQNPGKQETIQYQGVSYPACLYIPKYNEQDQQWYVNLRFEKPPVYGAVVRLVVAKYQHFAVDGCCTSRFVPCDFALLSAQRYVTFKRPGLFSHKVTLTVHGYGAYDTNGNLLSQIEVRTVRSDHGNFDWEEGPVLSPGDPTKYKDDVLWQGTVDAEFITGSTILIREKEVYTSAEKTNETDYRVVYSDAFEVGPSS